MDYQWNDHKTKANLKKHKVDFADAATVFGDDLAITFEDDNPGTTLGLSVQGEVNAYRFICEWRLFACSGSFSLF